MKLTDTTIKAAKPKEKAYKLSDGGGIVTSSIPCNFYISRKKMKTIESQIQIFWGIH
jgi:hypothetical protein